MLPDYRGMEFAAQLRTPDGPSLTDGVTSRQLSSLSHGRRLVDSAPSQRAVRGGAWVGRISISCWWRLATLGKPLVDRRDRARYVGKHPAPVREGRRLRITRADWPRRNGRGV